MRTTHNVARTNGMAHAEPSDRLPCSFHGNIIVNHFDGCAYVRASWQNKGEKPTLQHPSWVVRQSVSRWHSCRISFSALMPKGGASAEATPGGLDTSFDVENGTFMQSQSGLTSRPHRYLSSLEAPCGSPSGFARGLLPGDLTLSFQLQGRLTAFTTGDITLSIPDVGCS